MVSAVGRAGSVGRSVIQLDTENLDIDRDDFMRRLTAMNIGASVHFIPVHLHPYYRQKYGFQPGDFPNAFSAFQRIVSLPIYPKMTDQDVDDVIGSVRTLVEEHRQCNVSSTA